jgi:hypothetical protein
LPTFAWASEPFGPRTARTAANHRETDHARAVWRSRGSCSFAPFVIQTAWGTPRSRSGSGVGG